MKKTSLFIILSINLMANGVPLAPINVGAYNFTAKSARLSFKDLSDNEDGFRVYYNKSMIAKVNAKAGSKTYQYVNLLNLEPCKLYTVQLVSYNSEGESNPISKSFRTVGCNTNIAPVANAGENLHIILGDSVNVIGKGSDSDGSIVSYKWTKGDKVLSTLPTLHYKPSAVGIETLTLTVTDNGGATASDSIKILIDNNSTDSNSSNNNFVNIIDFGAIPNDNVDDTDAIEEALMVSGKITMPRGVYNVTDLKRVGKTVIEGNGSVFKGGRTPVASSNNILTLKTKNSDDRIEIRNLTLDGSCPTQYPRVGNNVTSLLHIYDSHNISLKNIVVKDFSSQYYKYRQNTEDIPNYLRINNNHATKIFHAISIVFSKDIKIKNITQENIKIEGLLVYESDNISIENFKSVNSVNIWTALHVVASDNIILKHVNISDGLVWSNGSSINFFANHHFVVSDVNTTHKHGFDISNEVINIPSGRVNRDTSYGVFENCKFEGYHPLQAYPTKKIHKDLKFINCKFIPSRVQSGAYGVRFQKAGNIMFDNCTFGNKNVTTRFNMIMGDTKKLTITNSKFINTKYKDSLSASIYIFGGEFGDINISKNSFSGVNYSPLLFLRNASSGYGSSGTVKEFRFINNIANEDEFEFGQYYKNFNLKIKKIVN